MICGSLLPIPPRLSNRDIPPPLQISSPPVPFFPRRRIGELYSIRRAAPLFGLAGRNAPPAFLPAFPSRLAGRLGPALPPRPPIRPIGFSPSSSIRFPSNGSASPPIRLSIRTAGRACFSRVYPFSLSIPLRHVIHYRYICGRGGTADTPDLGSGGEIRVGSNPTARTMATHSPPP